MIVKKELKDQSLALFFTAGVSLKTWNDKGMIYREVALYNELSKYFQTIYFFTYGDNGDFQYKSVLSDNIIIVPKKMIRNDLLYSLLLPVIHQKKFRNVSVLKTNQMWGSWSAVLTKIIFGKKLIIRTGYMLSLFEDYNAGAGRFKKMITTLIERFSYIFADLTMTSSINDFNYIQQKYRPRCVNILMPNYVDTDLFRPLQTQKNKGSICFIGRLSKQKNLHSLLDALTGLTYSLSIIGAGELQQELETVAKEKKIDVTFLGNCPNNLLPEIINQHELFILPSLYEGMPKTLLEAMSCGMPVIGTNVKGINEVIIDGDNGLLCDVTSDSIREAIIRLSNDSDLMKRIGTNARDHIIKNYSLRNNVQKERELIYNLV